jgi:hypothetical protein
MRAVRAFIARAILLRLEADEARDPVLRPEFVEDRAADAHAAVRLELDAAAHVEAVDGVHETEETGRAEVVDLDRTRESGKQAFADVANERVVRLDQTVLENRIVRGLEAGPDFIEFGVSDTTGFAALTGAGWEPTSGSPSTWWPTRPHASL